MEWGILIVFSHMIGGLTSKAKEQPNIETNTWLSAESSYVYSWSR